MIDVVAGALALFALTPLFVAISVAIVVDSGFPIFYRQTRVGRGFQLFSILKFRSMRANAGGPSLTVAGDTRITTVGAILRATKLDELPQLWNVIVGEMSLVGPRPEVPAYVKLFPDRYRNLLQMRPGITDPASIRFRHEEKILAASADPFQTYSEQILPLKLVLAEQYIENWSLSADLKLIFQTLRAMKRDPQS